MAGALTISGKGFNPLRPLWSAYRRTLRKHPLLTQAASSALLWGFGDGEFVTGRSRGSANATVTMLLAFLYTLCLLLPLHGLPVQHQLWHSELKLVAVAESMRGASRSLPRSEGF